MTDQCLSRTAVCGLCLLIVLMPLISGILFAIEYGNEKHYLETECLIINYTILSKICSFNTKSSDMIDSGSTCYKLSWIVLYNTTDYTQKESLIDDDASLRSYAKAVQAAEEHPVNTTSTCYYDKRDMDKVRWQAPSATAALILMIAGIILYILAGAVIFKYSCGSRFIQTVRQCSFKAYITGKQRTLFVNPTYDKL